MWRRGINGTSSVTVVLRTHLFDTFELILPSAGMATAGKIAQRRKNRLVERQRDVRV